jgi:hypothetical protein
MRKLLVVIACLASFGFTSIGASAAETHANCATFDNFGNPVTVVPNCTQTIVVKNVPQSMPSANPCTNAPGTISINYTNDVFHINVNGAGDIWLTQTLTGSATATPDDPLLPSYSGHVTIWFGASMNKNNYVLHDTFNATLTGTDGSTITMHMVDHLSANASGIVNTFSLASVTCG